MDKINIQSILETAALGGCERDLPWRPTYMGCIEHGPVMLPTRLEWVDCFSFFFFFFFSTNLVYLSRFSLSLSGKAAQHDHYKGDSVVKPRFNHSIN